MTVAVLLGDLGDERCGVGRSTAALVAGEDVEHLDPTVGGWLDWWRACGEASSRSQGLVVVYPTASTYLRLGPFARTLIAAGRFRRRWVRTHLHEYHRYGRRHRPFVAALAWLGRDGVVVSSEVERQALRGRWPSLLTRGRTITVVPPANGSAPQSAPPATRSRTGVVGVFGMPRPDKDVSWVAGAVQALPADVRRLELVGRGWDDVQLDAPLDQVRLGHVPDGELAEMFHRWDVALAPFADGPHDGRLSLRTPLAHGVPTVTSPPRSGALTLHVAHLHVLSDRTVEPPLEPDAGRRPGAEAVAAFEADVRRRLRAALLEDPGSAT